MIAVVAFERSIYTATFAVLPAEPDVGLMGEGVEITDLVDAAGAPVEIDDVALREGLSFDAAEALLVDGCYAAVAS